MPTFDVVSKVSFQELNNALSNCLREINTRYDFKGLNIAIESVSYTHLTLPTICSV